MRVDLMKCKRELSNAPTWKKLQNEVTKRNDEFTNLVKKSQSETLDRLQEEHGANLEKLAAWFEEHDDMAKARQESLDKKMKSCAKANELAELKENMETDSIILNGKVSHATKSLQEAMDNLRTTKEKSAFFKLNSHFMRFMNKLAGGAFNKWKSMNDEVNAMRELEEYRSKKMRKTLVMVVHRTLYAALQLWSKHCLIKTEYMNEQKRALKLMTKIMTRMLLARVDAGFKHWHRNIMLRREVMLRAEMKRDTENMRRRSLSSAKAYTVSKTSGLGEIMSTFQNDTKGAIDVITRELNALRFEELASLRRDWELEKVRNEHDSKQTLLSSLDTISARAEEFEQSISDKLKAVRDLMPKLRSELSAHTLKVGEMGKELKRVSSQGSKNSSSIDTMVSAMGRNDARMFNIEDSVAGVKASVCKLKDGERNALGLIEGLTNKLEDAEQREGKLKQQLADTVVFFEAEMKGLRDLVMGAQEKTEYLEGALKREHDYLSKFEESTVSETQYLRRMIEYSGVPKPDMRPVVESCGMFEVRRSES